MRAETRFVAYAGLVLAYRVAVLATSGFGVLDVLANLLGLAFLSAALFTFFSRRLPHASTAAAYLLASALHWGGHWVAGGREVASVVAYMLISGVLAHALLLELAIALARAPASRRTRLALWALPALCFLLGLASPLASEAIPLFLVAHAVQTNLYAGLAVLLLLFGARRRVARWLGLSLLVAWVPYLAARILDLTRGPVDLFGQGLEPVNLVFVAIPLGFALAQLGRGTQGVGEAAPSA